MLAPKQFVLPFAVQTESRKESFSLEAELAAIFALSELECKSGGLTSKPEKRGYVLKIGYPFWFIVRDNFTYVFDGLNRTMYNWSYYETSQIEFDMGDFEVNFRILEKYVKFLVNYQSYPQIQSSKELACEGLIVNNALFYELHSYHRDVVEVYDQTLNLLSPVLKEPDVAVFVDQIENIQLMFREKIEKLEQLSTLISKTTEGYIGGFNFELRAITEEVEAKIKAQREIIGPKVEKLTRNYKKQVERLEKSIDKEKQPIEKQKSTIEKAIKKVVTNIERYSKQVKIQAQKGNKRSEASLKKKLKKEKQEFDDLQKQQKRVENQLKVLVGQRTDESFRLKGEFEREVQIERQPITILEVLREEKQEFFKQESFKLEKLTQTVLEKINQLIVERENLLIHMELGFKSDFALKSNNIIIYVPFYIAAYSREGSKAKRYFVFPPSTVCSLGFSSKFKGVLGRAKIKDLFNERFVAVSSLGEKLRLEVSSNLDFEAQIEGLVQKSNLLDMKTLLREGLFLLKEEGWFSESEYQTFFSAV
jgi:hypothetical protein